MASALSLLLTLHIFFIPSLRRPEDKKQALLQFKCSLSKTTSSPSLENRLIDLESWNSSSDQVYGFFIVVGILYHVRYFVLAPRGSNF